MNLDYLEARPEENPENGQEDMENLQVGEYPEEN